MVISSLGKKSADQLTVDQVKKLAADFKKIPSVMETATLPLESQHAFDISLPRNAFKQACDALEHSFAPSAPLTTAIGQLNKDLILQVGEFLNITQTVDMEAAFNLVMRNMAPRPFSFGGNQMAIAAYWQGVRSPTALGELFSEKNLQNG